MAVNNDTPWDRYSRGTNPLYNKVYELLVDRDTFDTVLLNLSTICRNVVDHNKKEQLQLVQESDDKRISHVIDALSKQVCSELHMFLDDIARMLDRVSAVPLSILTYQYDYTDMIPSKFLRKTEDTIYIGVLKKLASMHKKGSLSTAKYRHVNLYDTYFAGNNVVSLLDQMVHAIANQHNVLHISHHPIDYHISSNCNQWTLVKSYTGATVMRDELGQHMFKKNLPYLKHLHILLGDRHDIIASLPKKQKDELIQVATDESWYLLPEDKIEERLRQLSYLTPYSF